MDTITGSCLCGAVEYTVENDMRYVAYCHCSQCRKVSGSAFSAFWDVVEDALSVTKGAEVISTYQKSEDSLLCFCGICGSSLFSRKLKTGMVYLRLGTLNEAPGVAPQAHLFVGSKASWHEIDDDLPRFETIPPR
jgi:hypothetical protein